MRKSGSLIALMALWLALAGTSSWADEGSKPGTVSAQFFTAMVLRGIPVALRKKGYPPDVAAKNIKCMERSAPSQITPLFVAFLDSRFSAEDLRQLDAFFSSPAGTRFSRMGEVTFLRKYNETTEELPQFTADEQATFDAFIKSPAGVKFATPEVQGAARPGTELDEKVGKVIRACHAEVGSDRQSPGA